MRRLRSLVKILLCWLALGAAPLGSAAAGPAAPALGNCAPCTPVSAERLAAQRGGFDFGGGLQASFGIHRAVTINGALVAEHRVHLPDLSRITASQAQGLQQALAGLTLVNHGQGHVSATPGAGAGVTLIQNALDGQSIRSLTVVDASSNSLRLLRGAAAATTLLDALAQPLAPR